MSRAQEETREEAAALARAPACTKRDQAKEEEQELTQTKVTL